MYTPEGNSNYTFLTFLAGGIILFIVTVIVPLTLIYVLSRPKDKLDDIEFKESWGMIYESLKRTSKIYLAYRLIYCFRRIAFIYCILVFDEIPVLQMMLLLYCNLGMTFYIANKPYLDRLSNRIELMNEFLMSSICYSCIIVTDQVIGNDQKYEGAWVMIFAISLTMLINIMIVIWFMLSNFKLICSRLCRK